MRVLLEPLLGVAHIIVFSVLHALPLVVVVWLARRRVGPTVAKVVVAFGFAASVAYVLIDLEHDIWHYGFPPASYLLSFYLPYMAIFGVIGWVLGAMLSRATPQRRLAR